MRTRFPPSPTGLLHVGGLRTALFNYLIAKQSGGAFLLRIEDTDQERSVPGAVEDILATLTWSGLLPDEGVILTDGKISQKGDKGPYIQSERLPLYQQHAQLLLDAGHAYYAFDTKEELDRLREEEQRAGNPAPKYDSTVRMRMRNSLMLGAEEVQKSIGDGSPCVIRLKVPENTVITAHDEIRGKVEFQSHAIDDTVLLKSDGFPTYHLANVVDDHLMQIDLVLRGEEWLPSLPKHILLYQAFGWTLPKFAHVPLLLNKEGGGKLSKRQGDVGASEYQKKGYLPEAMINFLALLGWNPGSTQEIFTLQELIEQFSLERVQKGGAVFDTEKLDWLQGQWMRKMPVEEFANRILPLVQEAYPEAKLNAQFLQIAALIQERITFLHEAPSMVGYFYQDPPFNLDVVVNKKQKVTAEMLPDVVAALIATLEKLDTWNEEMLKTALFALSEEKGWKTGQILWPLRAILTSLPYSPGAFEVAAVLGKKAVLRRLQNAQRKA